MEIVGFFGAVVIGLLLGTLGGGGSILAVPILVYFFHESPVYATGYSLFIVGISALIGSLACIKQGLVNFRTAMVFGIPSIIAVYFTRKFLLPGIPDILFEAGSFTFTKNIGIMVLFASLMIFAAISMLRKKKPIKKRETKGYNYPLILVEGIIVGVLTGLVGAGGGFLIIPALVLFTNIEMKEAVGTSLLIIALKSLIGFTGDISNLEINWNFLLFFTGLAIAGIIGGNYLSKYIPGSKLKPAFGWFILIMGIYIIGKELIFY